MIKFRSLVKLNIDDSGIWNEQQLGFLDHRNFHIFFVICRGAARAYVTTEKKHERNISREKPPHEFQSLAGCLRISFGWTTRENIKFLLALNVARFYDAQIEVTQWIKN